MKLIEAEKAKDVIHECFKSLMVNDASGADVYKLAVGIVSCLEHDANLLKAIDELPSAEPDTTTHGSNVVQKGINDGDRTSGDCISRQQAINKIKPWLEVKGYSWGELNMLRAVINELENMPSAQPETNCSEFPNNSDTISRQQAIDAVVGCTNCGTEDVLRAYVTKHSLENGWTGGIVDALDAIELLPSVQPDDDKLEKCRFEYVNACKILAHRTPDTSKKDIADAYAVVRALNPIFGEEGF